MTEREALKLALEALKYRGSNSWRKRQPAIIAIEEALAQPEQEPVEVFLTEEHQMGFKVGVQSFILDFWPDDQAEFEFMKTLLLSAISRAAPPQRTWVGLTADELNMIGDRMRTWNSHSLTDVYVAIEAKLKEKNGC